MEDPCRYVGVSCRRVGRCRTHGNMTKNSNETCKVSYGTRAGKRESCLVARVAVVHHSDLSLTLLRAEFQEFSSG